MFFVNRTDWFTQRTKVHILWKHISNICNICLLLVSLFSPNRRN